MAEVTKKLIQSPAVAASTESCSKATPNNRPYDKNKCHVVKITHNENNRPVVEIPNDKNNRHVVEIPNDKNNRLVVEIPHNENNCHVGEIKCELEAAHGPKRSQSLKVGVPISVPIRRYKSFNEPMDDAMSGNVPNGLTRKYSKGGFTCKYKLTGKYANGILPGKNVNAPTGKEDLTREKENRLTREEEIRLTREEDNELTQKEGSRLTGKESNGLNQREGSGLAGIRYNGLTGKEGNRSTGKESNGLTRSEGNVPNVEGDAGLTGKEDSGLTGNRVTTPASVVVDTHRKRVAAPGQPNKVLFFFSF
jgi:hypothetical protein